MTREYEGSGLLTSDRGPFKEKEKDHSERPMPAQDQDPQEGNAREKPNRFQGPSSMAEKETQISPVPLRPDGAIKGVKRGGDYETGTGSLHCQGTDES